MTRKLEIRLLNHFLLIAFAAMLIGMEFFFELNRADLKLEICSTREQQIVTGSLDYTDKTLPSSLTKLRNKIVIMFGVLTIVVAIVLMMFIKNITMPLQKMADVAQRINRGDLSQVVPVETQDEIGQVGKAINELTSNLQEVATFTATTTNETLNKIDSFTNPLDHKSPSLEDIEDIRSNLELLIAFVNSFKLLGTDIRK